MKDICWEIAYGTLPSLNRALWKLKKFPQFYFEVTELSKGEVEFLNRLIQDRDNMELLDIKVNFMTKLKSFETKKIYFKIELWGPK